jgi:hypothetical protein
MVGICGLLRRVAAVLVLLALVAAPVAEAATHGPGAVAAAADHAAWHGEMGHDGPHGHHGHHDAGDHDHSASVILPAAPALALPEGKAHRSARVRDFAGIGGEGLRRPPRA